MNKQLARTNENRWTQRGAQSVAIFENDQESERPNMFSLKYV